MKKILAFQLLMCSCIISTAQNDITLYAVGSYNLASMQSRLLSEDSGKNLAGLGLGLGLKTSILKQGKLYSLTEVKFTQRGFIRYDTVIRLSYFDLTGLLEYRPISYLSIIGGIGLGTKVIEKMDNFEQDEHVDFDLFATAGAGINLEKIQMKVSIQRSITNQADFSFPIEEGFYNHVLSVSLQLDIVSLFTEQESS